MAESNLCVTWVTVSLGICRTLAANRKLTVSFPVQVYGPRMDMTLAELQEMATRQQQQIDAQQQLLASRVRGCGGH